MRYQTGMQSQNNISSPRLWHRFLLVLSIAVLGLALMATSVVPAEATWTKGSTAVVVANRGSGDISVIDTVSLDVTTYDLPGEAEPMYVNHDPRNELVFVGDRANSTVVAFDDETYEVVGEVAVGGGVFHQWLDSRIQQLWVVGDTSQTVTVVSTRRLNVRATIDIPQDLVDRGGKPHDVFVDGRRAFVTMLGLDDGSGVVIQYSTRSFEEIGRVTVGGDPHVFVDEGRLYVASQNSSTVAMFRAGNLRPIRTATVPNAHGIFVTDQQEVLLTDIADGGTEAIWELNKRLRRVRDTADTLVPVPHNITVDNNRQAFITHSGEFANQVTVVELDKGGFGKSEIVNVGRNPFGIGFIR